MSVDNDNLYQYNQNQNKKINKVLSENNFLIKENKETKNQINNYLSQLHKKDILITKLKEKILNNSFDSIESKQNIFTKLSLGPSNNNEEIKFISDTKNVPIQQKSTFKSDLYEDKNESGKFGGSNNNFSELLKKLIEDKKTNHKKENITKKKEKNKNKIKNKEINNNNK